MEKKKFKVQEAILEISHKLKISKDGKNSYSNYDYFKPETIMIAIVPLLIEYRLFMKFDLVWNAEKNSYEGTLKINSLDDAGDFELFLFDIKEANVKGANPAMFSGATLTYCKRYSIMNAFNIADNKLDIDSDEMKKEETKVRKYTQADEILKDANKAIEQVNEIINAINEIKTIEQLTKLYKISSKEIQDTYKNEFTKKKQELLNQMIKDNGKKSINKH